jgi:hypothetical protein
MKILILYSILSILSNLGLLNFLIMNLNEILYHDEISQMLSSYFYFFISILYHYNLFLFYLFIIIYYYIFIFYFFIHLQSFYQQFLSSER